MSYRSHADLGGQDGHGRVVPEPEGELFHATWEREALALNLAMGATGAWSIDTARSVRETLPDYASSSYYQIWLKGLERLLIEHRLVGSDEIAAGRMLHSARSGLRVLRAADVAAALTRGTPTQRRASATGRYAVGERVLTRAAPAEHHTRLPGYARGKVGHIAQLLGCHVFADSNAHGQGEQPQWLYTVVFSARELWGDSAGGHTVSIDAWEPYLEPAP